MIDSEVLIFIYSANPLQVVSDPVGYGFVIRGSRPVYVHSVDPNGPAAAAGLKVRFYNILQSVELSVYACARGCCLCLSIKVEYHFLFNKWNS